MHTDPLADPGTSPATDGRTTRTWRGALGVLVTIVAAVTLVAMAASDGDTDPSLPPLGVDETEASDAISAIVDDAPIEQQPQLDEGVTIDEYSAAADDTVACLRDAFAAQGVSADISRPELSADRYEYAYRYRLGTRHDGSVLLPNVVSSFDQICRAAHLEATETVYQLGLRAQDDYTDTVDQLLKTCLHDAGLDAFDDDDPRDVAVVAALDRDGASVVEAEACIAAHPSITDVLPTEADEFSVPAP